MLSQNGRLLLIFQHGWGCDSSFFLPIIPKLKSNIDCEIINLEAGYYGANVMTIQDVDAQKYAGYTIVGVGHSLGFCKLLQSDFVFNGLISICGFVTFNKHKIALMLKNFRINSLLSLQVIKHFYTKCSLRQPDFETIDYDKLLADLLVINDLHLHTKHLLQKLHTMPSMALYSKNDFIVNNDLVRFTTTAFCNEKVNHGLGMLEAGWCCKHITAFLKSL